MIRFPKGDEKILPHEIKCPSPPGIKVNSIDINRFVGSLIGLAIGDALGASSEFRPYQYFLDRPVVDMEGGGTWGLKAGQWTDDTSMALCLASSVIEKKSFDPYDQMVRYKWWFKYGYMSSTGQCFDIGNATRESLEEFSRRQLILQRYFKCSNELERDLLSWDKIQSIKEFHINCSSPNVAGNGALMRLAPIPLFFSQYPSIAIEYAGQSARLTHGDDKAVDACRYYAALIVATIHGKSKNDILAKDFYDKHRQWFGSIDLHHEIVHIAHGSYKKKNGYQDGIRGKGYIVNALEAALWAFWSNENSFEKGALAAVNLGDDTDTTAAIYGQLAGAFHGYENIPKKWINKLYAHHFIVTVAQWIYYEGKHYQPNEKEQKLFSNMENSSNQYRINHQSNIYNSDQISAENKHLLTNRRSVPHLSIKPNHHSSTNQKQEKWSKYNPEYYRSDSLISSTLYNSPSKQTHQHQTDYTNQLNHKSTNFRSPAYPTHFDNRLYHQPDSMHISSYTTNNRHSTIFNSDIHSARIDYQQPREYYLNNPSYEHHIPRQYQMNNGYFNDSRYSRPKSDTRSHIYPNHSLDNSFTSFSSHISPTTRLLNYPPSPTTYYVDTPFYSTTNYY